MGILLVINNFLHDFAAGILFANIALTIFIISEIRDALLLYRIIRKQLMISVFALLIIVMGGIIRTLLYGRFEWLSEAGIWQAYVLIMKHLVLGTIAICGVYYQIRLKRKYEKTM